jgi:elongation factor Ts
MAIEISVDLIKKLRDKTGAGIMLCKSTLNQNNGDFEKSLNSLYLNRATFANKKNTKATKEGIIYSYIHTGERLGILVEINCETDFVSRQPEFKLLAKNIAMQIASSDLTKFIKLNEIPQEFKEEELKIERVKSDLFGKPDLIKYDIIEKRVNKTLRSKVLLEQNYIKDPKLTINDLLQQNIVFFGENIQIARFVKFKLGE